MSISNVSVGFDINKRGYKMSRMFFIHSNTFLTCVTAACLLEMTVNWRVVHYLKNAQSTNLSSKNDAARNTG